ncbi:MAG: NYN domain-containing protein [Gemmatimonadetes bacterium]|nr:NYN domain-containing protein [Candidatus Palauibacter rhopaloidicola]
MNQRLAILVDGDYMKIRLTTRAKRFPKVRAFVAEWDRIYDVVKTKVPRPETLQLYRVFYYTAEPFSGSRKNPLDGQLVPFSTTDPYKRNKTLIAALKRQDDVAVREGEMQFQGWELSRGVTKRLMDGTRSASQPITAADIRPSFRQKGVDMRIGLDIATLALKRLVTDVAVVTGDLDMVPALKLARREGLRVYLDTLGAGGRVQLRIHSDQVIG